MRTIVKIVILGLLATVFTSCIVEEILDGEIKSDTTTGPFNSLITTGILQKNNALQTKALTLTGTNGSNVITINFGEVGGDTTSTCLIQGNYDSTNPTQNAQILFSNGSETYTNIVSCNASITDCNEDESTLSGTFEGVVVSTAGDTLSFTNGTFEDVKFIVQ